LCGERRCSQIRLSFLRWSHGGPPRIDANVHVKAGAIPAFGQIGGLLQSIANDWKELRTRSLHLRMDPTNFAEPLGIFLATTRKEALEVLQQGFIWLERRRASISLSRSSIGPKPRVCADILVARIRAVRKSAHQPNPRVCRAGDQFLTAIFVLRRPAFSSRAPV
jgi:hypothetical protein